MTILNKIIQEKTRTIPNMRPIELTHRKTTSLINQFSNRCIGIIGEVKIGSPSTGKLSESFNLKTLVDHYNKGACAISVLTDEKFFYGGFHVLETVRSMTSLPILCKDFILSPLQIDHAYMAGADAILLIKRILDLDNFEKLLNHARGLSLDVLVEVDSLEDFESIKHLNFKLCGINNRNLNDFSIDFNKTLSLAPYIRSTGRIVISESGIESRKDLQRLRGNIDGCLMGQALVKDPYLLYELHMYKEKIKVKICGIKTISQARAIDGKADYIGLVLCDSNRKLSLQDARRIRVAIKKSHVVGVFRHQSSDYIKNCCQLLQLDYVQVHDKIELSSLNDQKIIQVLTYNQMPTSDVLYLVDSKDPGSGSTFDIKHLKTFNHLKYILAGGLNVSNVETRVLHSNCFCVDVSSGVENKGVKTESLMLEFIKKVGDL